MRADAGFGVGADYSDNITLAPDGAEQSAWVNTAFGSIRVSENTADAEVDILGTVQYRDYRSGPFSDEFVFGLAATGNWALKQSRVRWYVDDYFEQATISVFEPPTPENRQNANVLSTGPEARWRLSPINTLVTGARYANFYFEDDDTDSQQLSAYARWLYSLSERRDVSANAEVSKVDFFAKAYGDYRRGDAFLRLENRLLRSRVELDLGTTAIRRDRQKAINGLLGRLNWTAEFNTHSGLEVHLRQQYTDTGHDILSSAGDTGGVEIVSQQVTGDVFYSRNNEIGYHWQGVRSSWHITGAQREEDYETTPNDRRYEEGMFGIDYDLTNTLKATYEGIYRRVKYLQTTQVDTETIGTIALSYQIRPRLEAAIHFSRQDRDSNEPTAAFAENSVFLSLNYNHPPGDAGPITPRE